MGPMTDGNLFSTDQPKQKPVAVKKVFAARKAAPPPPPLVAQPVRPAAQVEPSFNARTERVDMSLNEAIYNLGPLLDPSEIAKYPEIFDMQHDPNIKARVQAWRAANGIPD